MKRLQEIYHRYKGAVFGYLYRMTGSAGEAEELAQGPSTNWSGWMSGPQSGRRWSSCLSSTGRS